MPMLAIGIKKIADVFFSKLGPDVLINTRMSGGQIDYAIDKRNIQKYNDFLIYN